MTHAFAMVGTATVMVTVTNDCGNSVTGIVTVQITPNDCSSGKLAIKNAPSLKPTFMGTGFDFAFTANATDVEDGVLTNVSWDFGDGAFAVGPVVTHTYATQGIFYVKAVVLDSDGNCRSVTLVVAPFPGETSTNTTVNNIPGLGAMNCSLLAASLNFRLSNRDTLTYVAQLDTVKVPPLPGQPFTIQIGNFKTTGTLDSHGAFKDATHQVKTKHIGQNTVLTLKVAKSDLKVPLGLTSNATIKKELIPALGTSVTIGTVNFITNVPVVYKSKAGGTGTLKK